MVFTRQHRHILGSIGLVLVGLMLSGCSKNTHEPLNPQSNIDDRVLGEWKLLDGNFEGTTVLFTANGAIVTKFQHKWMPGEDKTANFSTNGSLLQITEGSERNKMTVLTVEHLSPDTMVMVLKEDNVLSSFNGFAGRWKRISSPPSTVSGSSAFTGLKGVLAGKWQKIEEATAYSEPALLDFTEKSVEETRYGFKHVGKYVVKDDLITFTDRDGDVNVYGLEFVSDGEIALRPERLQNGTDFNDLSGRWRRISLPPNRSAPTQDSGPIADAKRLVRKVEALLVINEAKQKAALAELEEWATKLRAVGVNSPADLKGNTRGRRIGENMVTLVNEIEGRDQRLADLDTALLKANSLVRKLESEEATLTDAERRTLAVQLKEVEERTDGSPLPVTPLDVDAAVEKALKGSPTPKKSK